MDPNTAQPQEDSEAVKKLEEDLQNLSQQKVLPEQPPVTQSVPPVQTPPVQSVTETPVVQPTMPATTNIPVPENPKKSSPLMVVAIVLALIALLAVVAYVFGVKLLSPQPTATPIAVLAPSSTPDVTANWNTYTGDTFVLKYPLDFQATPSATSVVFGNSTSTISFNEAANIQNLTLANSLGNGPGIKYTQDMLTGKTIQNYQIGGVVGVGVSNIAAGQAGTALDVIWINNGKIYEALAPTADSATILNEMLGTFIFSSSTTSASPATSPVVSPSATP
jgi:hypothetical protein